MASRISGTVIKALDILDLFPGRDDGLSATQIAAATGINMSTVVRLCATLEGRRYLRRNGRGMYFVGPQVEPLARALRTQFSLEDTVRPVLRALRDETGESASFYVRDGDARICLYREDSHHAIRHVVAEGARLPLKEGVVGRVLLAYDGAKGSGLRQDPQRGLLCRGGPGAVHGVGFGTGLLERRRCDRRHRRVGTGRPLQRAQTAHGAKTTGKCRPRPSRAVAGVRCLGFED